jgi:hypothetical protein
MEKKSFGKSQEGGEQPTSPARALLIRVKTMRPRAAEETGAGLPNESKKTKGAKMAKCEVCGNDYDKSFEVSAQGSRHVFDSFECAIHALAPTCPHCGCKVVGHGVEGNGQIFCCGRARRGRPRLMGRRVVRF